MNPQKHSWYSISAKAAPVSAASAPAPATAEVFIYGDIGDSWYGDSIAAADFVKDFSAIQADRITVRINSYGGSVTDGIAMYNAMRRHSAHKTTTVDGVAYSISSLLALAGDTRQIAENALFMVHAPWDQRGGNAVEKRTQADMLDKYASAMATSYAAATGKSVDEIMPLLTDGVDHFYNATEAKAFGFVTDITNAAPVNAAINAAASARYGAPERLEAPAVSASLPQPVAAPSVAAPQPLPVAAATQPPEKSTMTPEDIKAAEAKAMDQGIQAEATRRDTITAAFQKFTGRTAVSAALQECIADRTCTPEKANAKLLDALGTGVEPVQGAARIGTLADETDKQRIGMQAALEIRAGLTKNDTANPFRGDTLLDMASASLSRNGVNTRGMDKMQKVAAAFTHSSGDFPLLLANIANKAMLKGWEEAGETFQQWTARGTLSDFKQATRAGLNTFSDLDLILPGGEYKQGTQGEHGAPVILSTYGKKFNINRVAIINDDMDAFSKTPRSMGRAAVRKVGNLVYAVLTANPTFNSQTLFHSTRNNLAASGTAITTTSVDAAMSAMALQADGTTPLNIKGRYLLAPVSKGGAAKTVMSSEFEVGTSNRNNTTPNIVRDAFTVITDARLDAASATAWYMAGDPAIYDTIEVSYLDGNDMPVLEQQNGWDIDGVEFKVRLDAGVAPLDYRALYKNPGA